MMENKTCPRCGRAMTWAPRTPDNRTPAILVKRRLRAEDWYASFVPVTGWVCKKCHLVMIDEDGLPGRG